VDTLAFVTNSPGTAYSVPAYRFVGGRLEPTGVHLDVNFVRGGSQPGAGIPSREGILVETLLALSIADLEHKLALVPAEEGARTLAHLRSALDAPNARSYRRQIRGVPGSYQP
jgi:hypothetical protein